MEEVRERRRGEGRERREERDGDTERWEHTAIGNTRHSH